MGTAALDFKKLGVVSITRGLTVGETIVKHTAGGKLEKFYTKCTDEEHELLVKEFKQYLKGGTTDSDEYNKQAWARRNDI